MAIKKTTKLTSKKKTTNPISKHGRIYVTATFNNTLVTITDDKGGTVSWSTSGASGYKGTRKSTPYAASQAVDNAVRKAIERGMESVDVYVKGPGAGRDSSLRAVKSAGLSITSIADITPIPHNGPRQPVRRRV
ncbi:MAG TPA: 30S ribosomal protein S11 [Patescibacteria group bacterium]|nr:30S ribosomal protein S11 [Patescibacteria group bacterium]